MKSKRKINYEVMRIIACFCVITIHSAVFDQNKLYSFNTFNYQAINIWGVLSRWAVPAFVMLSGMFDIKNAKNQNLLERIRLKVLRMIVLYIAWSVIYSFYNVFVLHKIYSTSVFKTFIDGCFSGELHMWYLLVQAGLYLIAPILSVLVLNLNEKYIRYWLGLLFLFNSIIPFIIHLNIKFVSVILDSFTSYMDIQFLGGWTLYFVLGYYINNHTFSKRETTLIYIFGLFGFVFTLCATVLPSLNTGQTAGVLNYQYPNIVVYSVAILLFFKSLEEKIQLSEIWSNQILYISKLTLGIYLSHVLILRLLYNIGANISHGFVVIAIPTVSFVTFILGGVCSHLIYKLPIVNKILI